MFRKTVKAVLVASGMTAASGAQAAGDWFEQQLGLSEGSQHAVEFESPRGSRGRVGLPRESRAAWLLEQQLAVSDGSWSAGKPGQAGPRERADDGSSSDRSFAHEVKITDGFGADAHRLCEHPAIMEPSRDMGEHPAVLVARTWSKRGYEEASKIGSNPALSKAAAGGVPKVGASQEPQS